MRLYIPGDFTDLADTDGLIDRIVASTGLSYADGPARKSGGMVVRFRFLHALPAGPLAVRPALPTRPTLPELLAEWTDALEGLVWRDTGHLAAVHVSREWARDEDAVEVSL